MSEHFHSVSSRESFEENVLQKRLLLCLYGLGTNTGLKRLSMEAGGESYQDLLYVKRKFIHKQQLRNAIAAVVNAIFQVRLPAIWGEGTSTCASDSKKFGAWDQNLMTEWHIRYFDAPADFVGAGMDECDETARFASFIAFVMESC